jgi:phosphoribosylformimino-5-aminoimidazole carboxamide ribotide isomerase
VTMFFPFDTRRVFIAGPGTPSQLAEGALRIIPVLDLKGGEVVRAEKGERDRYRPIVTRLTQSSDPVAVAAGLRSLYPFPTFYIADLDAIEGRVPNLGAIDRLGAMPDAPELWLDAGIADEDALVAALQQPEVRPVLGSESQRDDALLRRFGNHPRLLLSLDFFADGFRGPGSFLDASELWPQNVIVMTLAKVGAAAGPDFARLAEVKARAGGRSVIAAGGVRDAGDIAALAALGVSAVLVATALHAGTLTAEQIAALTT